ncbi:Bacteriophage holin family [uncultured Caudovirales phage]|uniref:Bacteriophage holin family n=1 Tax=uncultured Caudovirales phage TaxID=2100421 RepID=A0A6J5L0A3_9CAUD|nr:Bacteriophage holin family [uncultured Caudovirales phage]
MKTSLLITLSLTTAFAFIGTYFLHLTADNINQFLAVGLVVFADGFFGVWAGTKREGFQTRKALSVLKTFGFWVIMLSVILSIEKGFAGTSWLSETIMAPFLVFQLISILKNASMVGAVKNELVTQILDKLDKHKGEREL